MPTDQKLKTHKRYIFYRYYCGAVLIAWNVTILHMFMGNGDHGIPWWFPAVVIAVIPTIFMTLNFLVVPFDYGVFGKYDRTPFPEAGLIEEKSSSVRIGLVNSNIGVVLFLFDSGFGISMTGFGRFYIPFDDIKRIKKNLLSYTIEHRSKELSGSIVMYSRDFGQRLADLYEEWVQLNH